MQGCGTHGDYCAEGSHNGGPFSGIEGLTHIGQGTTHHPRGNPAIGTAHTGIHPGQERVNLASMHLRIFASTKGGTSYADILGLARHAEACGVDGFFRPDHVLPLGGPSDHIPTDVWTTLAGLARETSRIRLGSLMTAAAFRSPRIADLADRDHLDLIAAEVMAQVAG